jgi:hypothetical protein
MIFPPNLGGEGLLADGMWTCATEEKKIAPKCNGCHQLRK